MKMQSGPSPQQLSGGSGPGSPWPHRSRPAGRGQAAVPGAPGHHGSAHTARASSSPRKSKGKDTTQPPQKKVCGILTGSRPQTCSQGHAPSVTPTANTSPTSTVFLETHSEGHFANRKEEAGSGGSSGAELQIRSPESRTCAGGQPRPGCWRLDCAPGGRGQAGRCSLQAHTLLHPPPRHPQEGKASLL